MGREAASDAIVRPSERTLKARASLPVPSAIGTAPSTAIADGKRRGGWPEDQAERRNMWVYKHLASTMDIKSLITVTGLSPSSVERAVGELVLAGHIRQSGRLYARTSTTPYTDGELANAEFPGRARKAEIIGTPRTTYRTDALSKLATNGAPVPSESLDSYKEMYEAVSRLPHVGIRELDDVTKAFADAIRARMDNVRHDCPVCNRRVEVTYTKVHCPRCGYTIDVGDVSRALKLAEALKEGSE